MSSLWHKSSNGKRAHLIDTCRYSKSVTETPASDTLPKCKLCLRAVASVGKASAKKPKKTTTSSKTSAATGKKSAVTAATSKRGFTDDADLPDGIDVFRGFLDNPSAWMTKLKTLKSWQEAKWGKSKVSLCRLVTNADDLYDMMKPLIRMIQSNTGDVITGVWGNWYRDGNDYAPYHRDNYSCKLYTLSLGGSRFLNFKPNEKGGKLTKILVNGGDLYSFTPEIDSTHKHSVPKTKKYTDERISILLFTASK